MNFADINAKYDDIRHDIKCRSTQCDSDEHGETCAALVSTHAADIRACMDSLGQSDDDYKQWAILRRWLRQGGYRART